MKFQTFPLNISTLHLIRGTVDCQPGPSRGGRIVTITPENLHPLYSPPVGVQVQGIPPIHPPVASIHSTMSACGMNLPVHPGGPVNLPGHPGHPGLVGPPGLTSTTNTGALSGLGPNPHGYHRPSVDHLPSLHHAGAQLQQQQQQQQLAIAGQLPPQQHMLGDLAGVGQSVSQQTDEQPEEEEDDIIDDVDGVRSYSIYHLREIPDAILNDTY